MQPLPDDEFLARHGRQREIRLALAVVLGLHADERTRHEPIRVSVQNDVVLLAGAVRSWAAHDRAADIARSVPPHCDVCNTLRVDGGERSTSGRDEFDQIVAGLLPPPPPRPVPSPPLSGPLCYALLLMLWSSLPLPLLVVVVGLPAVPMLIATLAVTVGAIGLRRR